MINLGKRGIVTHEGYKAVGYDSPWVKNRRKEGLLKFQDLNKTKIWKRNNSIYVNYPTREIKKWFESRR